MFQSLMHMMVDSPCQGREGLDLLRLQAIAVTVMEMNSHDAEHVYRIIFTEKLPQVCLMAKFPVFPQHCQHIISAPFVKEKG